MAGKTAGVRAVAKAAMRAFLRVGSWVVGMDYGWAVPMAAKTVADSAVGMVDDSAE